jgi:hypothetical protein
LADETKGKKKDEVLTPDNYIAYGQKSLQPKANPGYYLNAQGVTTKYAAYSRYKIDLDTVTPKSKGPTQGFDKTFPEVGLDVYKDYARYTTYVKGNPTAESVLESMASKEEKTIVALASDREYDIAKDEKEVPKDADPNSEHIYQAWFEASGGKTIDDLKFVGRQPVENKGTVVTLEDAHIAKGSARSPS